MSLEARCRADRPCLEGSKWRDRLSGTDPHGRSRFFWEAVAWPLTRLTLASASASAAANHTLNEGWLPMRLVSRLLSGTVLVLVASGAACKNDPGVNGPTALEGQYRGAMAGQS